jgi:hypothetical protein
MSMEIELYIDIEKLLQAGYDGPFLRLTSEYLMMDIPLTMQQVLDIGLYQHRDKLLREGLTHGDVINRIDDRMKCLK